jgi:hypothetical protein
MKLLPALKSCVAAAAIAVAGSASAALIVQQGPGNFPNDDNVVFNPCSAESLGPATSVSGCLLLGPAPDLGVVFTSDELISANGGQATVLNTDGGFSLLTIALASGDIGTLILNIDVLNSAVNPTVTFADQTGGTGAFALDANGENFFRITGSPSAFVTLNTTTDIVVNVQQVRIGVAQGQVPLPGTIALLGAGLAGLGLLARRRRA